MMSMNIRVKQSDEYTLVTLDGKNLTATFASGFRENVCDKMSSFHTIIILDLTEVTFIDSSGLGAIVAAFKLLPPEGKLLLCGAAGNVRHLFKLTHLDSIFLFYPDVDTAIRTEIK
ncbi:MAG: anti-sigma factor antagonist [Candidatus Electrothrix sp. AR4]|nr:anti-sigma factor antagonist [Candidatus Electrothrix sp. AR4]